MSHVNRLECVKPLIQIHNHPSKSYLDFDANRTVKKAEFCQHSVIAQTHLREFRFGTGDHLCPKETCI
jgi:hypothetical protein